MRLGVGTGRRARIDKRLLFVLFIEIEEDEIVVMLWFEIRYVTHVPYALFLTP